MAVNGALDAIQVTGHGDRSVKKCYSVCERVVLTGENIHSLVRLDGVSAQARRRENTSRVERSARQHQTLLRITAITGAGGPQPEAGGPQPEQGVTDGA